MDSCIILEHFRLPSEYTWINRPAHATTAPSNTFAFMQICIFCFKMYVKFNFGLLYSN